jgi:methionyl-tRNA synthetase
MDALRYFLLRCGSLEDDADFSWKAVTARYNSELADTLGNLLSRIISMTLVPERRITVKMTREDLDEREKALVSLTNSLVMRASSRFSAADFAAGTEEIFHLLRDTNSYVQQVAPWLLAKHIRQDPGNSRSEKAQLHKTVWLVREILRICITLLSPLLPSSSAKTAEILGFSLARNSELTVQLSGDFILPDRQPSPPFPRIQKLE